MRGLLYDVQPHERSLRSYTSLRSTANRITLLEVFILLSFDGCSVVASSLNIFIPSIPLPSMPASSGKVGGSFHLTPGKCYENASNGNKSAVHWDIICDQRSEFGGGEILFDGQVIRRDGLFLPKNLRGLNPKK